MSKYVFATFKNNYKKLKQKCILKGANRRLLFIKQHFANIFNLTNDSQIVAPTLFMDVIRRVHV